MLLAWGWREQDRNMSECLWTVCDSVHFDIVHLLVLSVELFITAQIWTLFTPCWCVLCCCLYGLDYWIISRQTMSMFFLCFTQRSKVCPCPSNRVTIGHALLWGLDCHLIPRSQIKSRREQTHWLSVCLCLYEWRPDVQMCVCMRLEQPFISVRFLDNFGICGHILFKTSNIESSSKSVCWLSLSHVVQTPGQTSRR